MTLDAGSSSTGQQQRIDHFFAMPGARADRWCDLHAVTQDWARAGAPGPGMEAGHGDESGGADGGHQPNRTVRYPTE